MAGGPSLTPMLKRLVIPLALAAAFLAACGSADPINPDHPGASVYVGRCAICHGVDGTGSSGPALVKSAERYSAEEMATLIREGVGTMPATVLSDDELARVVAYVLDSL